MVLHFDCENANNQITLLDKLCDLDIISDDVRQPTPNGIPVKRLAAKFISYQKMQIKDLLCLGGIKYLNSDGNLNRD